MFSQRKVQMWLQQEKISSQEVRSRLQKQMELLRAKDKRSKTLQPEELVINYEDDHIVVIDKPSGVLTVSSEEAIPSLAQTAFQRFQSSMKDISTADQMIVHRLGCDTSGLIVLAKTMDAVRGMNTLFRTRRITRQYEALLCGHVAKDEGLINLPLMRDYEHPPYMRVSTEECQRNLLDLDPDIVGRRLLEAPKAAMTHFNVLSRESLSGDLPVTRVTLTSISGRTHQLNVHCAAIGHPIVRDSVYGFQGAAAPFGGLSEDALPADRASLDLEEKIVAAAKDRHVCVHAKMIYFIHPVSKEPIKCTSTAPF